MIGTTLSHYRITEKLGEGGMGEVYRAQDTNLDRRVAVKVLPNIFAGDPERLARFEREAKLLASLNHPNIAAIFGFEQADGKRFLVMELVEGETLAERIARGPLPVEEALEVCRQIAEGVEAAHEKGVIHRDLKPANVKITPEGKVKVLDFGLAKAFQEEIPAPDASRSPTLTDQMTRPGVILGTAAYMSPEQAKGKLVNKRTDIWAYGCVLYECLTAKKAFPGETATETLAAILKGDPDWTLLPANTPSCVRAVLRQCLQKDPNLRLHDIADARLQMREDAAETAVVIPVSPAHLPLRWIFLTGVIALGAGLIGGALVLNYLKPSVPLHVLRAYVMLEPGYWLDGQRRAPPFGFDQPSRTAVALSRDGRFMVYAAVKANPGTQDKSQLYLRRLDQLEAKPITGTEGGADPFLSPDGRWVGFWAGGKLMKVAVDGGIPSALCDLKLPFGFSWGNDDRIVFAPSGASGLSRISADGGIPESLTKPDPSQDEYSHRLPCSLPGGNGILFTIMSMYSDINPRIAVLELKTGKWRTLIEGGADARYVPTGHVVFLRQGTLMAIPFDSDKLEITGKEVPIFAGISQALNVDNADANTAAGQLTISISGLLAYASGDIWPDRANSLVWVDHKGNVEPITSFTAPFRCCRISPDDQRIAYSTTGKSRLVEVYDLNRGTRTRLTSEGTAGYLTWGPGGTQVLFGWAKAGVSNIFMQAFDESTSMERLTWSPYTQFPSSYSESAKTLAFVENSASTGSDVMLLSLTDRKVTPLLNSRFDEHHPEFSPDGRWIAYVSNESGRNEIYVRSFPGPGGKKPISNEGGSEPLWARNGKQLFYRQSRQVLVADVLGGSDFAASKPRALFEIQGSYMAGTFTRSWDISLDGRRFMMVKMEDRKSHPITELIFVQNWFEELKRLVPTGRK